MRECAAENVADPTEDLRSFRCARRSPRRCAAYPDLDCRSPFRRSAWSRSSSPSRCTTNPSAADIRGSRSRRIWMGCAYLAAVQSAWIENRLPPSPTKQTACFPVASPIPTPSGMAQPSPPPRGEKWTLRNPRRTAMSCTIGVFGRPLGDDMGRPIEMTQHAEDQSIARAFAGRRDTSLPAPPHRPSASPADSAGAPSAVASASSVALMSPSTAMSQGKSNPS